MPVAAVPSARAATVLRALTATGSARCARIRRRQAHWPIVMRNAFVSAQPSPAAPGSLGIPTCQ